MSHPRYAPGRPLRECPAATGQPAQGKACTAGRDGEHRCRELRSPAHYRHRCACDHQWISLDAAALEDDQIMTMLHPPRHAA